MIVFILLVLIAMLSTISRAILYLPYGNYTIPEGSHYSIYNNSVVRPRIFSLKNKENKWLKFTAVINRPGYYLHRNKGQINKLFGYSTHLFKHHHKGSVRLGWKFEITDKPYVVMYAYWYTKGGQRNIVEITRIVTNKRDFSVDVEMCTTTTQHIFNINGDFFAVEHYDNPSNYGWILMPYFGGQEPAPHDFNIAIQNITYTNSFIYP